MVQHVSCEPGEDYHSEGRVNTVKHGGGNFMIWDCTSAKGVGRKTVKDGTTNACYCSQCVYSMSLQRRKKKQRHNVKTYCTLCATFMFENRICFLSVQKPNVQK
uniref:Uncharacterized protein n=1 Tax=Acanthochromis polyacanthus TaxID=80966 RepID=A0A3Q1FGP6_9TELE